MFSLTVMSRNRLWFWGTCTSPRSRIWRGLLPTSDSPRIVMLPRLGRSSPLIVASRVDLPAPFGPTTQVIPPSATVSDTPRSTSPPPYPATTSDTSNAGAPPSGRVIVVALRRSQVGVKHSVVGPYHVRRPGDHGIAVV